MDAITIAGLVAAVLVVAAVLIAARRTARRGTGPVDPGRAATRSEPVGERCAGPEDDAARICRVPASRRRPAR